MYRKSNGPGVSTDEHAVRKGKSRKDQRHDQRVKEDDQRKIASKEKPTNDRKDRKVSRELNAELKFSNYLDARQKRLNELKYLLEIEDDEAEKSTLKKEIKDLIRNPAPLENTVEDSDDEVVILPKVTPSAKASDISQQEAIVRRPQQYELWGDDAPSEYGGDIEPQENIEPAEYNMTDDGSRDGYDQDDYLEGHMQYYERQVQEDSGRLDQGDSDSELSRSSIVSIPLVFPPIRTSPRKSTLRSTDNLQTSAPNRSTSKSISSTASKPTPSFKLKPTPSTTSQSNSSRATSPRAGSSKSASSKPSSLKPLSFHATLSASPPTSPDENLYDLISRTRRGQKKEN